MSEISEYVVRGGQALTAGEVDAFRGHIAAHRLKAETLELAGQSALREQALFLIRFIEDALDGAYEPEDFAAAPEAIFAVRYLAKGVDIIPDSLSGGYVDDAAVLGAVFSGHPSEFKKYSLAAGVPLPSGV